MTDLFTLNLIHLIVTAFLTGLIWTIQIVHYPLFTLIPDHSFTNYEKNHVRRIGYVVGPAMLVEVLLAILLVLPGNSPPSGFIIPAYMALACLVLIWLSTWFLQVPCHNLLDQSFDLPAIKRLVITNWIRTVLWTVRTTLAGYMLYLVR